MYYEVGVLSEAEFTRLIGLHPKDLKCTVATITNEEGSTMTGICVSLKEVPVQELFAMRKLRMSRSVKVGMGESLLKRILGHS